MEKANSREWIIFCQLQKSRDRQQKSNRAHGMAFDDCKKGGMEHEDD